jgi:hypothetical protein
MQSVNEGIKSLIKYFIQEGEVPEVDQVDQELSQSKESVGETEITDKQVETDDGAAQEPNEHTPDNIETAEHSILVRTAIAVERWIAKFTKRIKGGYQKIAAYSRVLLLLLLIVCLGAYVYSVALSQSETQILITASLSGLIASLTVYGFLLEWVENRPASALGGASALIVITTSASVFTSITNDVIIISTALIPALALITNIIVSSKSE